MVAAAVSVAMARATATAVAVATTAQVSAVAAVAIETACASGCVVHLARVALTCSLVYKRLPLLTKVGVPQLILVGDHGFDDLRRDCPRELRRPLSQPGLGFGGRLVGFSLCDHSLVAHALPNAGPVVLLAVESHHLRKERGKVRQLVS